MCMDAQVSRIQSQSYVCCLQPLGEKCVPALPLRSTSRHRPQKLLPHDQHLQQNSQGLLSLNMSIGDGTTGRQQ